jgi:hypothetical protein
VRTDAEEPLAHCLKGSHLLDAVRVEVLELQPVCEQHSLDEPAGGDGEATLVEATNDTTYPLGGRGTDSPAGTIHSMASVRGGSWPASVRRRSCSRETLERVQFDISSAKSWTGLRCEQRRRCGHERARSTEDESGRKKKQKGKRSPKPMLDARL